MTIQRRDSLIYSGQAYYLNEELLEGYFNEYPERKPKSEIVSSDLWRGYIATFEIRDDQLFVRKLETFVGVDSNLRIQKELFPNNNKFEWYSGLIRIDSWRYWPDEHRDFEYLEIYKGNFIQKRAMKFKELKIFKENQFEYFKTTEEYKKVCSDLRRSNPRMDVKEIDGYIHERILERYSKEVFDNKNA